MQDQKKTGLNVRAGNVARTGKWRTMAIELEMLFASCVCHVAY